MDKKRAVAYVRVSSKSDAQLHSFGYQMDYWQGVISANPKYEFMGLYADEGISGGSVAKRPQLKRLIENGKSHKFDVVFCKSVSRFGRNTEELLENVHILRDNGIQVFFEKEQIDTFDPSAETMLIVAASIAENDLQIYSENMRWSIHNRHLNGWVSIGHGILGYTMNKETNTLEIVPEQAEIVRKIYELYLDRRFGIASIVLELEKQGIKNPVGKPVWSQDGIKYILTNEKYKGCCLSQKKIGEFGMCRRNRGEKPQYYMENTHEAIIPPERFDAVQAEMKRRMNKKLQGRTPTVYPFSHKIVCGVCGHSFAHKINNSGKAWQTGIWMCIQQNHFGRAKCENKRIKDTVLKEKFVECFNEFVLQHRESDEVSEIKGALAVLVEADKELMGLKVNRLITREAYEQEHSALRADIERLNCVINEHEMRNITKTDFTTIEEFDEEKVEKFLEKVTIQPNVVTFTFINGAKVSREYSNGPSGNQKGWYEKYLDRQEQMIGGEYNADSE